MDKKCMSKDDGTGAVTISDSVAKRLQTGKSERADPKRTSSEMAQKDEVWLKKLKSMDDLHTEVNCLTIDNFEKVLCSTERQIALASKVPPCHTKVWEVIKCYQRCTRRTLNCENEVQGFILCVDETKKEMEGAAKNKNKMTDTFDNISEQQQAKT